MSGLGDGDGEGGLPPIVPLVALIILVVWTVFLLTHG